MLWGLKLKLVLLRGDLASRVSLVPLRDLKGLGCFVGGHFEDQEQCYL